MKKTGKFLGILILAAGLLAMTPGFVATNPNPYDQVHIATCGEHHEGCSFQTLFGEESSDGYHVHYGSEAVDEAVEQGLSWIISAQQANGGWGSGTHYLQNEMNPHAVATDPATTSMAGMALLRGGNTLTSGTYSESLRLALNHLLSEIEGLSANATRITDQTGTQIQTKLGQNIDAVLAAQFLTQVLELPLHREKKRVESALQHCIRIIEDNQAGDGSIRGDGWAGVLQSSLANNALESAQSAGMEVDEDKLNRSRAYQKGNYDPSTRAVNTDRGAGIVLYSVSGSVRASAQERRQAVDAMQKAKDDGVLDEDAPVDAENLQRAGLSRDEAERLATGYQVFEAAKQTAQDERVMSGFGNNGGEEFLSYLQTGESMIIGSKNEWQTWYENMAGRMLSIQNEDGSWNGHHCITSPVFCTATCLLILTIDKDIERLSRIAE